jgi:hypothetical protein
MKTIQNKSGMNAAIHVDINEMNVADALHVTVSKTIVQPDAAQERRTLISSSHT